VLVPRPETELLVDWASECLAALASDPARATERGALRAVDLGTGSGAIALALKNAQPGADVTATDISTLALAVARRNAERLGLAVELVEAWWWRGLEGRRFDIAVANPPYVAAQDPHLAALRFEPALALTPGGDGLGALRALAAGAGAGLLPGGRLIVEHGFDQAAAVRAMLGAAGLTEVETRRDLAGLERATSGRFAPV
ncbi:MAG: HemK family protein methyltransferase, partial [Caldimonas sp.]